MNKLNNILERSLEIAKESTHKEITFTHIEKALMEDPEITSVIRDLTCNSVIETIKSKIDVELSKVSKFSPTLVKAYQDSDSELPITNDVDIIALVPLTEMIAQTKFVTGNVEISHIMLTCLGAPHNFIIYDVLSDNGVDANTFVETLMSLESDNYGMDIPKDPELSHACGMPPMEEADYKNYIVDLTETCKTYRKPFVGREDVINRAIQVLCRMDKSNPCFVGEPGVGKTEVTIGIAKMLANNTVPKQLQGYKLYSVDLPGMLAGAQYRGQFEKRLKALLDGVKDDKVILFFDEIHTIVGAGATTGSSMDASNILKPYLTQGNTKFIGATTYKEFKANIEKDSALMRRFQKVEVKEPSISEAIEILNGLKTAYEDFHGVSYTEEAITTAVEMTAKYVHDRFLPDKAIDIMDESGAWGSINKQSIIDKDQVTNVISELCKIPKQSMEKDEFEEIKHLEKNLKANVFGQDNAISEIVESIKLSKSGLSDEDKPIASFLFVGPTGTGKTEIAKQLAKHLSIDLVRFDMSEYMEENSISKLIGTSAGYVGYENGGLLTEAIRKTPHCVLLLDEIEKAHPAIFKSFLQIMDYGKLTDNQGRVADFRNTIIIMTSNAGATMASKAALGFGNTSTDGVNYDNIKLAVKNIFTPEFRNRLTKTVVFNGINDEIGRKVVDKELKALDLKLALKGISAKYTDDCINQLVKLGVSPDFGAREIQRLINSKIKVKFVDIIISGVKTKKFVVDYDGTDFTVKSTRARKSVVA